MKRILSILVVISGVCSLHAQQVGMSTDKGRQNAENQDYCDNFACGSDRICIVCDGVGGNAGGQIASRTAVETIRNYFRDNRTGEGTDSIRMSLTAAMMAAHEAIIQHAAADTTLRNMASTCLIALVRDDKVYYAHVGDCRLYHLANGRMTQLTTDDSYMDYLIAQGEITPRQAKKHPLRRAIFNALGVEGITPRSDGREFTLGPGEYALMCSDGLYTEVKASRIGRTIYHSAGNCDTAARKLVDAANKAGGSDNITAIVIKNDQ